MLDNIRDEIKKLFREAVFDDSVENECESKLLKIEGEKRIQREEIRQLNLKLAKLETGRVELEHINEQLSINYDALESTCRNLVGKNQQLEEKHSSAENVAKKLKQELELSRKNQSISKLFPQIPLIIFMQIFLWTAMALFLFNYERNEKAQAHGRSSVLQQAAMHKVVTSKTVSTSVSKTPAALAKDWIEVIGQGLALTGAVSLFFLAYQWLGSASAGGKSSSNFARGIAKLLKSAQISYQGISIQLDSSASSSTAIMSQIHLQNWTWTVRSDELAYPEKISEQEQTGARASILRAARSVLEDLPELRVSPSGLQFKYYISLAERDPRMAVAALRPGFEILLRNVFEIGPGLYIQGRDIRSVLADMEKQSSITSAMMQANSRLFDLIEQAEKGAAFSQEDALSVIALGFSIAGYYCNWLISKDREVLTFGTLDPKVYLDLAEHLISGTPPSVPYTAIFELLELVATSSKSRQNSKPELNKEQLAKLSTWVKDHKEYFDLRYCCAEGNQLLLQSSKEWENRSRESDKEAIKKSLDEFREHTAKHNCVEHLQVNAILKYSLKEQVLALLNAEPQVAERKARHLWLSRYNFGS